MAAAARIKYLLPEVKHCPLVQGFKAMVFNSNVPILMTAEKLSEMKFYVVAMCSFFV